MVFRFKLNENLLNEDEQFYDYGTAQVSNDQIFDTSKTGMSFYDNFLNSKDLEYMRSSKNLDGKIIQMTPNEYFDACAEIFNSSRDAQMKYAERDTDVLEHLKKVITEFKKRFPLGFISYAEKQQEGRHRMYVAGQLFGFNHKFPVLVIDWFDKDLQIQRENNKKSRTNENNIVKALNRTLDYKYDNLDEFANQLESELGRILDNNYRFNYHNNKIEIIIDGLTYIIEIRNEDTVYFNMDANEMNYEEHIEFYDDDYEPDDLDDIDDLISDMSDEDLDKYMQDNFGLSLK